VLSICSLSNLENLRNFSKPKNRWRTGTAQTKTVDDPIMTLPVTQRFYNNLLYYKLARPCFFSKVQRKF